MDEERRLSTSDIASSSEETDHGRTIRIGEGTGDVVVGDASGEGPGAEEEPLEPLLASEEAESYRMRWERLQVGFVDEPRVSVEQADSLVAELMQRLAEGFSTERSRLEAQWGRGEDVSTEDLRVALQRYRSFFQRLLSA